MTRKRQLGEEEKSDLSKRAGFVLDGDRLKKNLQRTANATVHP
jgi:hypothetical protein